ncbi:MAG: LytTR family DNA-binding domain-containing protein [Bacteroidetes bacterium]|nr:LytTR family DNA-binding domain-containing protein [Bacteroidota bacterium]MBU1114598.1 LytTR family DNA-binding domain-containing protein [Bacteroidota bacterium]MBU1799636.1 LytTR family DNA-binding domain-containing protein [Bacteroidota bacterium]
MKKYSAFIVDDEKLAREDLKAMLEEFNEIEIIGEASSVEEAEMLLKKIDTDLLFLDIQMPVKSGFELLRSIDKKIKVIFVTAFDEYAIKAFEINAQDYLLKPVTHKRLELAIERLNEDAIKLYKLDKKFNTDDNIFIMINNSFHFVKISTIIKISSAGNYSELVCSKNIKGLVLKTMKEWEERLPDNQFVRIHRNTIINIEYVDRVDDWFNSSFQIFLKDEPKPLIMSRRFALKLKEKMK